MPARTFVLALDAVAARDRQNAYLDRIEREDAAFRGTVADAYREPRRPLPGRVVVLDGTRSPRADRGAGA